MSLPSAEITQPATEVAMSTYRPGDDLLDCVLAALPPLIADAPLGWHRTHRTWVGKEIAAFRPADAVEAMFVGQIVVLRHLAASLVSRAGAPGNSVAQARRLDRCAVAMMRAGAGLERTLRREQRSAVPPGGEWAGEGFDLAAMEAFWRGIPQGEMATTAALLVAATGATPGSSVPGHALVRSWRAKPAKRPKCRKAAVTGAVG
jgi:hypothetical protein